MTECYCVLFKGKDRGPRELGKATGVSEIAWLLGDFDIAFVLTGFSMVSVPAQSIPVKFKDF